MKETPGEERNSIQSKWAALSDDQWHAFARDWLAELEAGESAETDIGQAVVLMSFSAQSSLQWKFIEICVSLATSDEHLGHIAAGPFEHLLGHHGAEFIDAVEKKAAADAKFAKMVRGAWQYLMSDDIWKRIQLIQKGST